MRFRKTKLFAWEGCAGWIDAPLQEKPGLHKVVVWCGHSLFFAHLVSKMTIYPFQSRNAK